MQSSLRLIRAKILCSLKTHSVNELELERPIKKKKKGPDLLRRYPVGSYENQAYENEESLKQHESAIATELKKAKPRDGVLLP